jgi:mycothiol synthase
VQRGDNLTVEMCGGGVDEDLLECLLLRNDELYWWTRHNSDPHHNTVRTLLLLSRQLPAPSVAIPQGFDLRTFNPDVDACAWLKQNNAAFANHPEQGAWRLEDLEARLAEPWFDPSGFLLICNGAEIAASCWTKVHELSAERFGEIYVLSVNPSYQGQGLGRVMLSAGLSALRHKGVSRVELFVDEDNISALALYQSLSFTLQRKDLLLHFSN